MATDHKKISLSGYGPTKSRNTELPMTDSADQEVDMLIANTGTNDIRVVIDNILELLVPDGVKVYQVLKEVPF